MASLEIIDLIQQNLEQEGILTKIRAQLLASVVNILNGKDEKNNNEIKDPIHSFISTDQGYFNLYLIHLSLFDLI